MKIAVIPARGGSQRIPRKNIRDFCGKPMISWPIELAQGTGLFDYIFVSTDDEEIRRVAVSAGALAPFLRPPDLADNHTPTRPVIIHAVRQVEQLIGQPEYVCCIYPTSPFLRSGDLCEGLRLLREPEVEFAFAAARFSYPIQRALKRTESGGVEMYWPEELNTRSQDLEEAFHDAGQFYWGRTEAFLCNLPMFGATSRMVLLPSYRVHDIDTEEDWMRAEVVFRALQYG